MKQIFGGKFSAKTKYNMKIFLLLHFNCVVWIIFRSEQFQI